MKLNTYQKLALITIVATVFLILVGSLVRVAGAGLGCPDWPKCFGLWVPPTDVSQLPPQFDSALFNPTLTWIEYVNRLVGVTIGFLILLTFISSFQFRKSKKSVFVTSALAFIGVVFQGWLGKVVVETELHEGMITIHMVMALVIVCLLLYAIYQSFEEQIQIELEESARVKLSRYNWLLFLFTMVQVVLGTRVREGIDFITNNYPSLTRGEWLNQPHVEFLHEIHRSGSWLIIVVLVLMTLAVRKITSSHVIKNFYVIWGLTIVQISYGIVLAYWGMPKPFQVLHLVNITLLVLAEMWMILILRKKNSN
ncbi:heme A synthase [bacterium]|nr:MAG: heme A synthase [bacterium]